MSKSGSFPQGLANSSGLVGKNLTFHTVPAVGFTTEASALGFTGFNGHVAVDDLHRATPTARVQSAARVIGKPNAAHRDADVLLVSHRAGYPMARSFGGASQEVLEAVPARRSSWRPSWKICRWSLKPGRPRPTVKDRSGLPVPAPHAPASTRTTSRCSPGIKEAARDRRRASGRERELALACAGLHADRREDADERRPRRARHGTVPHGHGSEGVGPRQVVPQARRPESLGVDGSCFPTSGGYNLDASRSSRTRTASPDQLRRRSKRQKL
jgi:hypothetical protein